MYENRQYQVEAIDFLRSSLQKSYGVALESPTGSGKTIMALKSALQYSSERKLKVLYLVRTNSQEEQVIKELRSLSSTMKIRAIPMQGRVNMCILYRMVDDLHEINAESLAKFCNMKKREVMAGNEAACPYFNFKIRSDETKRFLFDELPTAEEFYDYGERNNVCPYESMKAALPDADIVIAPYAYFLNRSVAEKFLSHWGVSRNQIVIILDEAHNLPDIGRSIGSFRISVESLNRADREAQAYGDPELSQKIHVSDLIEMIRSALQSMVSERCGKGDVRIRFQEFMEYMRIMNKRSEREIRSLLNYLYLFGEYVENEKEKVGKVPFSYCSSVASRIIAFSDQDEEKYAAILSPEDGGYMQAACLDPSGILEVLKESKTIHMSGTLDPFDFYSDITGFEIPFKKIGEIFPPENRYIAYYDGVSSKYDTLDEKELDRMATVIEDIILKVKKNTIVYFPSYSLMDRVENRVSFEHMKEYRGIDQKELYSMLKKFRRDHGTIFAVSGGRLSEGINFPGNELEMIILAGLPFPRPDAINRSLFDYYERKYGKGWEYSVVYPTAIKIRQEIGRLIRSAEDTGACVILDKRAGQFRKFIPDMKKTSDPASDIYNFFISAQAREKYGA
ncbi:ATP-dependent DNA helicase [Thermoplasma acidophilum]|uniref:ATP-dependent DNA helicase n=1 Tax=Thermoplasma acidophilum TaxID=2303 RepID=UPI000016604F|nr:ATP-dependent DNA helicase [Thermoplasma acidophilum]4A15_A Chain A, ATP-DEPENDENT DNA HELICASE TA0057 [Thermoplasma acidophilum]